VAQHFVPSRGGIDQRRAAKCCAATSFPPIRQLTQTTQTASEALAKKEYHISIYKSNHYGKQLSSLLLTNCPTIAEKYCLSGTRQLFVGAPVLLPGPLAQRAKRMGFQETN